MRRLAALLATVLGLFAAAPALAQTTAGQYGDGPGSGKTVTATGVLQKQGITAYQYGTHFMSDDGSGTGYALKSGRVDLDRYVGERVTVYGTLALRPGELEGGPALINVERVVPATEQPYSVRGVITDVDRGAKVVLVEEDPSAPKDSARGEFSVTGETVLLRQQGSEQVPATFADLTVGRRVEATYTGPVTRSYPPQGTAGKILILEDASNGQATSPPTGGNTESGGSGNGSTLPDTGGLPLIGLGVAGAALLSSGFLVRRVTR